MGEETACALEPVYVVDVETANNARSSICSVAIVSVEGLRIDDVFHSLIDPEDEFGERQVRIHGITPEHVHGAPTIPEIASHVRAILEESMVASHTMFDRQALDQSFDRYGLDSLAVRGWLDTWRIARTVWPELGRHGLAALAENLGIQFEHHDALQDARTAGHVFAACRRAAPDAVRSMATTLPSRSAPLASRPTAGLQAEHSGDVEGHELLGRHIVFTGALCLPRWEVVELATAAGASVRGSVTRRTTLLVVGVQTSLGGNKSSKHRRAEELNQSGQAEIGIISEAEFIRLLAT